MKFLKALGLGIFIVGFFYFLTFFAKTGDQLPQPNWAMDNRSLETYLIDAHSELLEAFSPKDESFSVDSELDFLFQKN